MVKKYQLRLMKSFLDNETVLTFFRKSLSSSNRRIHPHSPELILRKLRQFLIAFQLRVKNCVSQDKATHLLLQSPEPKPEIHFSSVQR
jgi:hypothetical protein